MYFLTYFFWFYISMYLKILKFRSFNLCEPTNNSLIYDSNLKSLSIELFLVWEENVGFIIKGDLPDFEFFSWSFAWVNFLRLGSGKSILVFFFVTLLNVGVITRSSLPSITSLFLSSSSRFLFLSRRAAILPHIN